MATQTSKRAWNARNRRLKVSGPVERPAEQESQSQSAQRPSDRIGLPGERAQVVGRRAGGFPGTGCESCSQEHRRARGTATRWGPIHPQSLSPSGRTRCLRAKAYRTGRSARGRGFAGAQGESVGQTVQGSLEGLRESKAAGEPSHLDLVGTIASSDSSEHPDTSVSP